MSMLCQPCGKVAKCQRLSTGGRGGGRGKNVLSSVNIVYECSLKYDLVNFDMLTTFSFGVSSNLSQQKSPKAEIIGIYFLGIIAQRCL